MLAPIVIDAFGASSRVPSAKAKWHSIHARTTRGEIRLMMKKFYSKNEIKPGASIVRRCVHAEYLSRDLQEIIAASGRGIAGPNAKKRKLIKIYNNINLPPGAAGLYYHPDDQFRLG